MIDLEKLENKIDALLEAETSNNLTRWLLNKRVKNLSVILGDGAFVSLQERICVVQNIVSTANNFDAENQDANASEDFCKAA